MITQPSKFTEINIEGVIYLCVNVNGILRPIKPVALVGWCRRPGSGNPQGNSTIH
jgi:hypothetical protein